MPNRIVREGINTSARLRAVSEGAELFYRRLLSVVDDHGRYHGHPTTLRAACWPVNPDTHSDAEIRSWLHELGGGERPLLRVYENDGAKYILLDSFGQRVQSRSKFPSPPFSTVTHGESTVSHRGPTVNHREKSVLVEVGVEDEVGVVVERAREPSGDPPTPLETVEKPTTTTTGTNGTKRKPPNAERGRPTEASVASVLRTAGGLALAPTPHRPGLQAVASFAPADPCQPAVSARDVAVVRDSLVELGRMCHLPPPDEAIVLAVIRAAPADLSGDEIHATLVDLWKREKFRAIRSWGLVPLVVRQNYGAS